MLESSKTLTSAEETTLRTAAFGAVVLISMSRPGPISSARQNVAGALALTSATGLVGRVLAVHEKIVLKGTVAEVAERVLPALSEAIAILAAKAPGETGEFKRAVRAAVEQAIASTGQATPAQRDMAVKITSVVDAA